MNENKQEQVKITRPTNIAGIQAHHLEVVNNGEPKNRHMSNTSDDSLDGEVNNADYNENGNALPAANSDEDDEKRDASKDESDDAGLSDEGLGDITSEASNSPQPPMSNNLVHSDNDCSSTTNNNAFECTTKSVCDNANNSGAIDQEIKKKKKSNNNISLPTSPCDERVPSRIPFPKQKSQTNL